jgi:membrane peptidoglycan carboxypeptidase
VKLLYLVGINDSIGLAERMGITTLIDPKRYGLSLVLGGGEVKLLDLVSVYGTFAADGQHYPYRSILEIQDKNSKTIYKAPELDVKQVLSENSARLISDILSDDVARSPLYGTHSKLYFPGKTVAAKTGTTNDYRDAWILGYTPYIAVGAWAGNNDNSSMEKKISGLIVAPMWNEFMQKALADHDNEPFEAPNPIDPDLKPILAGNWRAEGAHTILYSIDKNNPLGPTPSNPARDPQYKLWETGVQNWLGGNSILIGNTSLDGSGGSTGSWSASITAPSSNNEYNPDAQIPIVVTFSGVVTPERADVYVNNNFVGSFNKSPFVFSFVPSDVKGLKSTNTLKVTVYDQSGVKKDATSSFKVAK